jgi:hypothetical protein
LRGPGIEKSLDRDRPGLTDSVEPAVDLAVGVGREIKLVVDGGRERDQVVETRADGNRIDEEDLDALGEDVLVDPDLAPGGWDLLGVEPGDLRRDLTKEL